MARLTLTLFVLDYQICNVCLEEMTSSYLEVLVITFARKHASIVSNAV